MPVYGCFTIQVADPIRTWTADYITPERGGRVQFWSRSSAKGKPDVLLGSAHLERGQTICDVGSTTREEQKTITVQFVRPGDL